MKLYSAGPSPFARKVMALLHETNQFDDVEIVDTTGTAINPGAIRTARNPLGKIPSLERPGGPALYDSRVICRFLDARAGGKLYPEGDRLWDTLTLEATADGIMEAAMSCVYEQRLRPEDMQYQPWIDAQWGKASSAISALNSNWISFLKGPLTMGHIAVACALGYVDFRHSDREWQRNNDALASWFKDISNRDSLIATLPHD